MFFGRGLLAVSLVLLLGLFGCAGSRTATAHRLSERHWVLVTTENFRVYSDLDGDRVQALAVDLEKDLALIAQAAFGAGDASIDKTEVIVFAKNAHFHRHFSELIGGVSYRAPLLPESPHTVVTAGGLSSPMRNTLRHELVHDLFARRFGAVPPWLSEGFAEYFSTVQLVGSDIHVGKALPDRILTNDFQPAAFERAGFTVLAIPARLLPTPTEILRMSAQEFYGWESDPLDKAASLRTAANYFVAWALVHFLMDAEGEYSSRFNGFLREVRTTSVKHAWHEAFADIEDGRLNEDFRSYLAAGHLSVGVAPYHKSSVQQAPTVRTLATGEKHILFAKLALAATQPVAENVALFLEHVNAAVLSQEPPPEAYYLRGVFAASRGKDADAERDFTSAVQLAPKDPRFLRASLGHQLSRSGERERSEVLKDLRAEIEKLEALSSSPLDLLLAAQFFAEVGETDRALTLGSKAASRAPVDPIVLAKYATVLAWSGDVEGAVMAQRRALEFVYEHRELQKRLGDDLERLESLAKQQKPPASAP